MRLAKITSSLFVRKFDQGILVSDNSVWVSTDYSSDSYRYGSTTYPDLTFFLVPMPTPVTKLACVDPFRVKCSSRARVDPTSWTGDNVLSVALLACFWILTRGASEIFVETQSHVEKT